MARVAIELVVNSASDLESLKAQGYKKLYVVVSLSTDPKTKQKTQIKGGAHPSWNSKMKFFFDVLTLKQQRNIEFVFQLKCQRVFGANKKLGELRVRVLELFRRKIAENPHGSDHVVTYAVHEGSLTFSYSFARATASRAVAKTMGRVFSHVALHGFLHVVAPPLAPMLTAFFAVRQLIKASRKGASREAIRRNALNANIATASIVDGVDPSSVVDGIDPSSVVDEALNAIGLETIDPSQAVDLILNLFS